MSGSDYCSEHTPSEPLATVGAYVNSIYRRRDCDACMICTPVDRPIHTGSIRVDDVALELARRGASYHEIMHVMVAWATMAAERAIVWAKMTDGRERREDADALCDTWPGADEDPES